MRPTYDIELVRPEDADGWRRISGEAFGVGPVDRPSRVPQSRPGWAEWGAYAGAELVGVVAAAQVTSWWGGAEVSTCAVAGVTVAVEHRGAGLLTQLFRALLDDPAATTTGVSTLFPTATGIYRRFGYELVSSYDTVDVASGVVSGLSPVPGVRLRRAGPGDLGVVDHLYSRWASAQNGPLARRGPALRPPPEDRLAQHTGITLAEDAAGAPLGYVSWSRGEGYGPQATLTVGDLVAGSAEAYRALWASLGSHAASVGTIRLHTSGADVARTFLPTSGWQVTHAEPYLLRVVDLPTAFAGRRTPLALDVTFAVAGDDVGHLDGAYRLVGEGGPLRCERVAAAADAELPTYAPRGLALAYAGRQSSADIRALGLLTGPSGADDVVDAALGGRQLHIRDYF